jgi:exopolysaccharide production protein ExoY
MNDTIAIASREDISLAEFEIYRAVVSRRRAYLPVKRGIDIMLSATMLILFSPFLLGVAAMIRTGSPGPVLYRTRRHGRNMKPFMMLKFRSMMVAREADDLAFKRAVSHGGVLPKSATDPRITPIGRWIRRWSVDELPQLINVLRGDMSLIGPRPVMPEMLDPFPMFARARALVRPGVGGLWQVRERGSATHVGFMWDHDLEYLDRMSFHFDLAILLRTALAALRRTGAA